MPSFLTSLIAWLAVAEPVRVVHCDNCGDSDLDRLIAAGTLLSVVLAVVAVILARQSAKAAERSAEAAREQLVMMREEHAWERAERAKKSDVGVRLSADPIEIADDGAWKAIGEPVRTTFCVGMFNDGDRDANDVLINVLVPEGVTFEGCNDRGMQRHSLLTKMGTATEFVLDEWDTHGHTRWTYFFDRRRYPAGARDPFYFSLAFPQPGTYPVGVLVTSKIEHLVIRKAVDFRA